MKRCKAIRRMHERKLETFQLPVGTEGDFERFTGYRDANGREVIHGLFEFVSADGTVLERGRCKDGWRVGTWVEYYDNGRVHSMARFRNGKHEGRMSSWYNNGAKEYEWNYRDNLRHGVFRDYSRN